MSCQGQANSFFIGWDVGGWNCDKNKDSQDAIVIKGIHVLAKFAPEVKSWGVWSDGELLTAIEADLAACKNSRSIETLRQQVANKPVKNKDKMDALTCALIAYLFSKSPEQLIAPRGSVPPSEGWIWVPKDILKEVKL